MKFKKILKENIISKIIEFYKKSFLFGSSLGIKTAFWLKKYSSKIDFYVNLSMDFLIIGFNLFLFYYWFLLFSNNLTILFLLYLINLHTIIVFVLVCKDRFLYIRKNN
jgi:hypothetical protein